MIPQNTYATIDLNHLIHNYQLVKQRSTDKKILCIVKADAYGHGATMCAKTLMQQGADYFAVASLDEAIELRDSGIDLPILILGFIPLERIEESLQYDVSYTIYSMTFARHLNEIAEKNDKNVMIHIKINTGMNRLGFRAGNEAVEKINLLNKMKNLVIEGICSHFATADEEDADYTKYQYELFADVVNQTKQNGIEIPLIHIANSAAIAAHPDNITTAVRPGIILYGMNPSDYIEDSVALPIKPVMNFYAKIANISILPPGESVSYGRKYYNTTPYKQTGYADTQRKIAVVSAGYADGYFRALSNKAEVIVNKKRMPIIGNICMDMFMIDITGHDDVKIGDDVLLFGEDLPASELAELIGTIPYELTCSVSKRVKRIYIGA